MNTIFIGYLITYTYLLLVMGLSFTIFKFSRGGIEVSRKIVHIFAGLGWIILAVFFRDSVHMLVITGSFVFLTLFSQLVKGDFFSFFERRENDYGTIIFTVSMFLMSVIAFLWPAFFVPFGIGILSLAFGDGFAGLVGSKVKKNNIIIYKQKSLFGVIACVLATILSTTVVLAFMGVFPQWWKICIIGLTTGVIELFSGKLDNLCIPFSIMFLSYCLI